MTIISDLNNAVKIVDLYQQYAELGRRDSYLQFGINDDLERIRKAIESGEYWIQNMTPSLPIEQIRKVFDQYQVIQLREVGTSTDLLLGCGNTPANPHYKEGHDHPGMDTINPQLSMNPTVVAAWGVDEGLNDVLPKDHYENFYGEAMTLSTCFGYETFISKKTVQRAFGCLKDQFKTYEVGMKEPFNSFYKSFMIFHEGCIHRGEMTALFKKHFT